MAIQTYLLKDGSTLEITTTDKVVSYKESTVTSVDKSIPYKESTTRIIPVTNTSPVVAAGIDQQIKLPISEVTLVGQASDADGIASVLWEKVGGAGTIVSPTQLTTKVTGLIAGDYIFRLTATDTKGGKTSDDLAVKVLPADTSVPKVNYLALPVVGPQDFSGKSNLVFENKRIVNAPGVAFKLYSGANNITIRNCFFDGAGMELVELEDAFNITIENCLFARGYSGVHAVGSRNIKVINCQFVNMRIRYVNGGFAGRGTFAQFNTCSDIQFLNCKGENFPEANPEDMISFFNSSNGLVKGNIFRGNPTSSWSTSGGGIICGDNGGNNVILESNVLMSPGNYGLAVAGGTNMVIRNNKIYSEKNAVSNNPLYVWAQAGVSCSNITVTGNRVYWIDKNGTRNNGWNAGNCSATIFEAPTNITLAEMGVPTHLIDFVTPSELLIIRK